jgi:hypothetical protein
MRSNHRATERLSRLSCFRLPNCERIAMLFSLHCISLLSVPLWLEGIGSFCCVTLRLCRHAPSCAPSWQLLPKPLLPLRQVRRIQSTDYFKLMPGGGLLAVLQQETDPRLPT